MNIEISVTNCILYQPTLRIARDRIMKVEDIICELLKKHLSLR